MTLRDHARQAIRREVVDQAWLLFAHQGYAATTVEQIADAAGMSRRTFFRYFGGKDELIRARLSASGDELVSALQDRPAAEPVWRALRSAFDVLVAGVEAHEDVARRLHRMLQTEPEVRAAAHERGHRWTEIMEPIVAERLPRALTPEVREVRARSLVGSALACFDAAQYVWASLPGARLGNLLDDAMGAVAPADQPA